MAVLLVTAGPKLNERFDLDAGRQPAFILGKANADIVLADPFMANRHAEVSFIEGSWILRDLGSPGGTSLNGKRINGPAALKNQNPIRCGSTTLVYLQSASLPAAATADIGQTTANLAHSIKNIIQAINGSAEVIDHAFESGNFDRAAASWGILKRNLERMRKFAVDILAFSADSKTVLVPCRLNEIVEPVVESLRPPSQRKGIAIVLEMNDDIPVAKFDADKMHEAVLNLLLNALDAVEEKTGLIEVGTEFLEKQRTIRLTVKDNGCGIKPEDQDKIWLPFHTTKAGAAAGLGLAIVKRIVEQHGGTIALESQVGAGSKFAVLLPIRE